MTDREVWRVAAYVRSLGRHRRGAVAGRCGNAAKSYILRRDVPPVTA